MTKFSFLFLPLAFLFAASCFAEDSLIAPGAQVEKVVGDLGFTEGPAANSKGDLYFTDDPNNKIYFWSVSDRKLSTFVDDARHSNGTYIDQNDHLYVCEGGSGRVVCYAPDGERTVVADKFDGKRFNKPNDLWIDPKGGIYFTDPVYGREFKVVQDGEHVYYIPPDRGKVLKVAQDLERPNGIIGTPNGKTLYVTDERARTVWRYDIREDGTLVNKTKFGTPGIDGMTIDNRGNVYITEREVIVFSPEGKEILRIKTPEVPANVCFGGADFRTLFITARNSVYSIQMNVSGVARLKKAE